MLISRFVPIIAPIAFAASLAAKKPTPVTVGTLRTDTITFGFVLLGTILLIGALLFLPVAALGTSRGALWTDSLWRLDDQYGNQHETRSPDKEREHVQRAY